MLKGKSIILRPVRYSVLNQLYSFPIYIDNRVDFFPRGMLSQPAFQKQFQDTEFWSKGESMLVIVSQDDLLLGHIELFMTVNYLDEYELSYQVYTLEQRGKGVATEAVQLLVEGLRGRLAFFGSQIDACVKHPVLLC